MGKPQHKVVLIKRGFLGIGDRRRQEKAMNKWAKKGYRYVETVKKWRGYELIFELADDGR